MGASTSANGGGPTQRPATASVRGGGVSGRFTGVASPPSVTFRDDRLLFSNSYARPTAPMTANGSNNNGIASPTSVNGATNETADSSTPYVPPYMGSLRRVIVSSNRRILKGGSRHYRPARTTPGGSSATSLNNTFASVSLLGAGIDSGSPNANPFDSFVNGNRNTKALSYASSANTTPRKEWGGAGGAAANSPGAAASGKTTSLALMHHLLMGGSAASAPAAPSPSAQQQQQPNPDHNQPTAQQKQQQQTTLQQQLHALQQQMQQSTGGATTTCGDSGGALIDPANPNLMLCGSLGQLLTGLSPFCFADLDEVYFRTRPSAAKGEDADAAVFAALNDLHFRSERDQKEGEGEGGGEGRERGGSSPPPKKYTIPPCMLFGRGGRDGDENGSHAHDTINADDLDPRAITVRGYPLLMSRHDAFALFNFIKYDDRKRSPSERYARERRIAAVRAERRAIAAAAIAAATTTASQSDPRTAHMAGRFGGGSAFRDDDEAPIHPRLFAGAEVVAGTMDRAKRSASGGGSGSGGGGTLSAGSSADWFDARPICPLQLHMDWLSGTRLWVPTVAANDHEGKKKGLGGIGIPTPRSSPPHEKEMTAEEAYFAAIYNEKALSFPLAPIMHPPPPLSFSTATSPTTTHTTSKQAGGGVGVPAAMGAVGGIGMGAAKVAMSPMRRKGQSALLTDPNWGNPYYTKAKTAVTAAQRVKEAVLRAREKELQSSVKGRAGGGGKQPLLPPQPPSTTTVTATTYAASAPVTARPPPAPTVTIAVNAPAAAATAAPATTAAPTAATVSATSPRGVGVAAATTATPAPPPPAAVAVSATAPPTAPTTASPTPPPAAVGAAPLSVNPNDAAPTALSATAAVPPLQVDQLLQQQPTANAAPVAATAAPTAAATAPTSARLPPAPAAAASASASPPSHVVSAVSHPLLKHLLRQRLQDHLDYAATQAEPHGRQRIWRAQLEARRVALLAFVKEGEAIKATAAEIAEVLFYKKRQFGVGGPSASTEVKAIGGGATAGGGGGIPLTTSYFVANPAQFASGSVRYQQQQRKQQQRPSSAALVGPSPLVERLRGMIEQ